MERAAQLLAARGLTVREVAHRVGYRQPAQFAKAFRRHHGLAPSAFRDTRRFRAEAASPPSGPGNPRIRGPPSDRRVAGRVDAERRRRDRVRSATSRHPLRTTAPPEWRRAGRDGTGLPFVARTA